MTTATHKSRFIPIWMFDHPRWSLADRILLAMSSYLHSSDGYCHLDIRTLSVLMGETTWEALKEGNPSKEMKKVRMARQRLVREGHLIAHPRTSQTGVVRNVYEVVPHPMKESVLGAWNRVAGKNKTYEAAVEADIDLGLDDLGD